MIIVLVSRVAATKYHNWYGFKNKQTNKNIFSQFWMLEAQDQGVHRVSSF